MSSTKIALSKLVFPALLVPAISIDLEPSTMKLMIPAATEFIILVLMNNGRVHGLSLCLLKANASPLGFNGGEITAILAFAPGIISSVSRIGLASSNGLPLMSLNFDAQDSASGLVGTILVLQSA